MLIERRLRLLSTLLAAKRHGNPGGNGPKRVFVREDNPAGEDPNMAYIATQLPRWEWAFLEARDALDLSDVATSAIIPSHYFSTKKTSTYNRNFRVQGRRETEKFESVSSGQIINLKFTLSQHVPPNTDGEGRFTRPPDEQEFDEMLAHIGKHLGISEWGHARLFGRFEIHKFPKKDESKEEDETPQGGK